VFFQVVKQLRVFFQVAKQISSACSLKFFKQVLGM